jgi:tRNA-binding protein
MQTCTYEDFLKLDIRVGTIISAEAFAKARKPAYQLEIDFGNLGVKKSSAQITVLYSTEELVGMQIVAVVNFPPKQIADFISECLLLGALGENDEVILLQPTNILNNGLKIA